MALVPRERGRRRGTTGGDAGTAARRRRAAAQQRLGLGCSVRCGNSTRTTASALRTQRWAPGVATAERGGARRAAVAGQVRRARERAVKRGIARRTQQRAPHLHARLPKRFTAAERRRRSGIDGGAARLGFEGAAALGYAGKAKGKRRGEAARLKGRAAPTRGPKGERGRGRAAGAEPGAARSGPTRARPEEEDAPGSHLSAKHRRRGGGAGRLGQLGYRSWAARKR
jgi:hypothetical protein